MSTFIGRRVPLNLTALAGLSLIVISLRWAFRSQYLFDNDAVLYARALDLFDLTLPQPQPPLPGYRMYILLGEGIRSLVGEPNTALVLLSALMGALLIPVVYLLAWELFDRRTALVAALLTVAAPSFWFQSSLASPRIGEALVATTVVWLGVRARRGDELAFWLLPFVLGLGSGVRQQLLVYLLPFLVWATWRYKPWQQLVAAQILVLCVLSWLLETVTAAGGLTNYRLLSTQQYQAFVVGQTGVMYGGTVQEMLRRLTTSVGSMAIYSLYTVPLLPLLALPGIWSLRQLRFWVVRRSLFRSDSPVPLILATAPALGFLAFVHIQQIGHFMAVAPFLVIVTAWSIMRLPARAATVAASVAVGVGLLCVLAGPSHLWRGRIMTPTVAAIQQRDQFVREAVSAIQAGRPDETVVLTTPLSYLQIEHYAPAYQVLVLPGLFEPKSGCEALTNSLRPLECVDDRVPLPDAARRIVAVGWDEPVAAMLLGSRAIGSGTVATLEIGGSSALRISSGSAEVVSR